MTENAAPSSKPRYVWDREKLAWVEAAPQPNPQEQAPETRTVAEVIDSTAETDFAEDTTGVLRAEAAGYELRGAGARLLALALDFVVLAMVNLVIRVAFSLELSQGNFIVAAIGIIYFVSFWWWRGQTPGKMIIGAKIVRTNGEPIGIGRAILRYVSGYFLYGAAIQASIIYVSWVLGVALGIIVFLSIALSRDKRGLHDRLAGTIVINTRPKTMEEYADEEYEEEEPSYTEAEQEPLATEKA